MVTNRKEHTQKTPGKQAPDVVIPKPMKIGASTPYDFQGSNMTAYGGLLPVVTMLEKLQFQELIEQHVTIKRLTTSMPGFRFVLAMILALYLGFSRLNHLQFLGREPMLTGILEVGELPVQSTFWRFLGAPVNWRILWNGRSPPCELPVQHVAERAWSESNPLGEASGGEPVSRNEVNSIRPRDADERRPARLRG